MKYAVIGVLLIFYSMFLTPSYWEPTDPVVSTTYLTLLYSHFDHQTAQSIAVVWMLSGYLALILGVMFLGLSARRYFPYAKIILKHPLAILAFSLLLTILIVYFFNLLPIVK